MCAWSCACPYATSEESLVEDEAKTRQREDREGNRFPTSHEHLLSKGRLTREHLPYVSQYIYFSFKPVHAIFFFH